MSGSSSATTSTSKRHGVVEFASSSNKSKEDAPPSSPKYLFNGVNAYFVEAGVSPRRLQIWSNKFQQYGGHIEDHLSHATTHVFAADIERLKERFTLRKLKRHHMEALTYEWIQDCLKEGVLLAFEHYALKEKPKKDIVPTDTNLPSEAGDDVQSLSGGSSMTTLSMEEVPEDSVLEGDSLCYLPPNVNHNITKPFTELRDIYKDALGDDRRSFSYHKSISVLEKIPYKIENIDQVKGLPTIGKSMLENIREILTTGKLSKLENFKSDEKVRTLTLFSSIWGIGPATAQKLYEKGYRTLEDLRHEHSLTASQKVGLRFYDDLNIKIPRHEVKEMETLVKQVAEEVQLGVNLLCGGSYRRGKAFCSDMDFVATHPDGKSHEGFLVKLIAALKNIDFLTEDLLVSANNSIEKTDSGVDTYYGLCKYPGRQRRHRIDFKVYSLTMYPFGLIAWTGNDVLNRRLRLLAESKGYKLDDTGLSPLLRDSDRKKAIKTGAMVALNSEREVFDFLGFPWLEPHERNL